MKNQVWTRVCFMALPLLLTLLILFLASQELRVYASSGKNLLPNEHINLADGKPAKASSSLGVDYAPGKANDHDPYSFWHQADGDENRWWQVDLLESYVITRVEILGRYDLDYSWTRRSFEVQASNDVSFASYVILGAQGAVEFPFRSIWVRDVNDRHAYRYVRFFKTNAETAALAELRLFGYARKADINWAQRGIASASSDLGGLSAPGAGNDGAVLTFWHQGWDDGVVSKPYWQVDLKATYVISSVEIISRQDDDVPDNRRDFDIWASNSPTFTPYILLGGQGSIPFDFKGTWVLTVTNRQPFRYIRFVKNDGYAAFAELCVFGSDPYYLTATNSTPVAVGETASFTATLSGGTGASFYWNFRDGQFGSGELPTHTFNIAGLYDVELTVTVEGHVYTATLPTRVVFLKAENDGPTPIGKTTTFTAIFEGGTATVFDWDFGDGEFASGSIVTHTYQAPNDYFAQVYTWVEGRRFIANTQVTVLPYNLFLPLTRK